MIEATDLIGVEIGRYSICATVLDSSGTQLLGYADHSILHPEETYGGDSRFPNPGPAVAELWRKLKLEGIPDLRVAVTLGVGHAGIGSGPAIEQWVDSLAVKIGDPITKAGDPNSGVSYIPTRHLGTVVGVFRSLGVVPQRIELPPVAVVRVVPASDDYSVSVASGIGWKARVHEGKVLEAVAYPDGLGKEGVFIEAPGAGESELASLDGVQVPANLLTDKRMTYGTLAVSVGAAKGLISQDGGNFSSAQGLSSPAVAFSAPASSVQSGVAVGTPPAQESTDVVSSVDQPTPKLLSPNGSLGERPANGRALSPGFAPPGADSGRLKTWKDDGVPLSNGAAEPAPAAGQRSRAQGVNNERLSSRAVGALDYSADDYTDDRAALFEDQVPPALKALVGFLVVLGILLLLTLIVT